VTSKRSPFAAALAERNPDPAGRRWLYVPYDQLSDAIGPLVREDPRSLGIVLVESPWKAARRPYHRQKLALVLANQRWFALEQAARGVAVRHVVAEGPFRAALEPLARELGPLRVMRPAERELREDLAPLVAAGGLTLLPHEGWLTTERDFRASQEGPPYRMDAFYRQARRRTGILMRDGKPVGGKWSFDAENRKPWRGAPAAVEPPPFPPDPIKEEVGALVERRFARHPGRLDLDALPARAADAEALWAWAKARCLPHFGPFEDAMSATARSLFHTRISSLVNLHRLLPARVVADAAALDLPLAGQEGFIRQVLGWREYVRHVHEATDGFRALPAGPSEGAPAATTRAVLDRPGDGGYARWAGAPWPAQPGAEGGGGATPSFLGAAAPLPPAFWGAPSGLRCLDTVVASVWEEGYSHHITRLMVLSNLATLLGVSPRELTDWFWVAYTDAYDWVVEPNVLGMGTFGAGEVMTTKPYVSGAAYIARMSDYCKGCAFDPARDCPVTRLYWAFLSRSDARVAANPRLKVVLAAARKRPAAERARDEAVLRVVSERLAAGQPVRPADVAAAARDVG